MRVAEAILWPTLVAHELIIDKARMTYLGYIEGYEEKIKLKQKEKTKIENSWKLFESNRKEYRRLEKAQDLLEKTLKDLTQAAEEYQVLQLTTDGELSDEILLFHSLDDSYLELSSSILPSSWL